MTCPSLYFIADLHLAPASPGVSALFLDFLKATASRVREHPVDGLFILGDLFEVWIGDDDLDDPFNARIVTALRQATDNGLKVRLLHGNRDFLLGTGFVQASGVELLPDPFVLTTPEWQFVLSHGDALCLDDAPYQAFRAQVRDPAWQAALLARPRGERRALAAHYREASKAAQRHTGDDAAPSCSDLQAAATDDFLRAHGYATFIHGHTHRPATHDHIVDGIHVERWVLADWREHDGAASGECLVWNGDTLQREALGTVSLKIPA